MKKKCLLLLFVGIFACTKKPKVVETAKFTTHKEAIDTLRVDEGKMKPLKTKFLTLTEKQKILTEIDLSSIFVKSSEEDKFFNRIDGFYGNDKHRIEFFFSSVTKDEIDPSTYHVKGKNRFKKNITNFEGIIRLDTLMIFDDPNIDSSFYMDEEIKYKALYASSGIFEFKEDSTAKYSGIFSGKITMDFRVRDDNQTETWFFSNQTPSKGSGYKLTGFWESYLNKTRKPIILAKDIFIISNDILVDFSIGERDVEINPKYRHLGWDNYWEMDEWWNDTKAIL